VSRAILLLLLMICLPASLFAHEMRPAYLAIEETADGVFDVQWKVPALGDQRLGLYARLPASCTTVADPIATIAGSAYSEHWTALCGEGLKGKTITIDGLTATLTDVLVRIAWGDGSVEVARLTPEAPGFRAKGAQTRWEVAATYFRLGVDHILSGLDHLLFVFALILLIRDRWMLVKTITAFTFAHSITLAGATLGLISLPTKPVEAAIALSIVFLAVELAKAKPGTQRLSERLPWLVAFAFGLLHGFGFAGALMETGLPQSDVPLALLTFNLGVEAGQLLFVAVVLSLFRAFGAIMARPQPALRLAAAYGIGTASMLWLIDRLASFGAV
jgi:hydrogenase/urease accessory protein HupE